MSYSSASIYRSHQRHYEQYHKPGQSSRSTMQVPMTYQQGHSSSALFGAQADYARTWWLNQNNLLASGCPPASAAGYSSGWDAFDTLPPLHHEGSLTLPPLSVSSTVASDFPPSPTDVSSNASESGPSPGPDFVHAICNAPIIAPKPLPYHSPTFLQFDLPDDDEDLSHPPYVSRPHKRKRDGDGNEADDTTRNVIIKRRATPSSWARGHSTWAGAAARAHQQSHRVPQTHGWAIPAGIGGIGGNVMAR
ncbi:hypothetical protein K474DRAFT_1673043 [Panus rudis PR-1116 ss-1]|nr:hypothetical protein K474DRAFT_1673043 [Panus rudis PR-1116 ss-1]